MPDPVKDLEHVPPVGHFEQFTIVNNSGMTTRPGSYMAVGNNEIDPVVADMSGVISGPVQTVEYQQNDLGPTWAEVQIETDFITLETFYLVPEEAPYTILSVQIVLGADDFEHEAWVWLRSTDPEDHHLVRQPMDDAF